MCPLTFGFWLIAIFVVPSLLVLAWLLYEIRMDKIAQADRDMWRELTREPVDRWPPRKDV